MLFHEESHEEMAGLDYDVCDRRHRHDGLFHYTFLFQSQSAELHNKQALDFGKKLMDH